MHKDGSILLLNEARDTAMVEHRAEPEAWDTCGAVLDVLNIAGLHFELLEVLIIEFLSSGVELSKSFLSGKLCSCQNLLSLFVYFAVQSIVFEFKSSI